jgi:signal transduction histidine kinase
MRLPDALARRPGPSRARPAAADRLVTAAQRRLAITTLVVLAGLLVSVGATTAILAARQLDASVDRTLEAAAQAEIDRLRESSATGPAASEGAGPGESEGGQGDEGEASPVPTIAPTRAPAPRPSSADADDHIPAAADTFFLYLDSAADIVANPERVALTGLPDRAAASSAATTGRDLRTIQAGAVRVRLLTLLVPAGDGASPPFHALQAGFVLTLHDEQVDTLLRAIVIVGLGGLIGAAVVSVLLTRRALGPVRAAFERERRFVAAASHELRTPIAVIRSSAEVLGREGSVTNEGERLVSDIVAEADRLGGLVAELSDLAVAQAKPAASTQPVDLAEVAADVAHRARPMAEAAGLWLEAPEAASVMVHGDRDRIVQVALILIDNAIRHTPPTGVVRVTVSAGRGVGELAVADEGPGIAPEDRDRIFEPFARLSPSASGGSGLGLSIARAIVAGMAGRIRVGDAPGHGSLFTISLPAV